MTQLKIQPKIFIDNEVSLATGYTLSTGYSIGQIIHFNNTGNEYSHKLDGIWIRAYSTEETNNLIYNLFGGNNYVVVYGIGTPSTNATELQAAYNLAKTMSPSSTNIINVIVAPGTYTFGITFNLDTDWINILPLTEDSTIKINGINVAANNVILRNIDCGTNSFSLGKDDGSGNIRINNAKCYNCLGGVYSFGSIVSGSVTITSSDFNGCTSGNNSFGFRVIMVQ